MTHSETVARAMEVRRELALGTELLGSLPRAEALRLYWIVVMQTTYALAEQRFDDYDRLEARRRDIKRELLHV